MPGIAWKLLSVIPGSLAIVFALGAVGALGTPARINGGLLLFLFLLVSSAVWLVKQGNEVEAKEEAIKYGIWAEKMRRDSTP